MFEINENAVKVACERIGGVTRASNVLGVSNGAVHSGCKRRRAPKLFMLKSWRNWLG